MQLQRKKDRNCLSMRTGMQEKKLLLRVELPAGSYLKAKVRWDGAGRWQTVGDLRGKEETTALLRIPPRRCDKLELRLEGRGPFALLSWLREFRLGSDV